MPVFSAHNAPLPYPVSSAGQALFPRGEEEYYVSGLTPSYTPAVMNSLDSNSGAGMTRERDSHTSLRLPRLRSQ
jgi:hypothetical protein